MTPDAFQKICESFKFPKAIFRYQLDWDGRAGLVIEINDVIDIFTGARGPLHNGILMSDSLIEAMDEKAAKEFIRGHLRDTLIHEMDENLEVANDRPWYPHGAWSERKHLVYRSEWSREYERNPIAEQLMEHTRRYYQETMDRMVENAMRDGEAVAAVDWPTTAKSDGTYPPFSIKTVREAVAQLKNLNVEIDNENIPHRRNTSEPQTAERST